MKYSLNFFGYAIDCNLTFSGGNLNVEIPVEDQASLRSYLLRVLVKYGREPQKNDSLEVLVKQAIEVEKNMNGHMSEPKVKLPYEFQPAIKDKLVEAADLQDMSATQLLIRLIEKKYQSVIGEEN